jgi:hypothetical protein
MPDTKQQLTELIEAYAVAKSTGNQLLAQNAATGLLQFLETVEVSKVEEDKEAVAA